MATTHSTSFPVDLLDEIVTLATDSGGHSVTRNLCFVSRDFHFSAAKGLYRFLFDMPEKKVAYILHTSIPLRPQIASWVRILVMDTGTDELVDEAAATFTCLTTFGIHFMTTLDPECTLPLLRRFVQLGTIGLPLQIAQHLTHLVGISMPYDSIAQLAGRMGDFKALSHILIFPLNMKNKADVARVSSLFQRSFPHGFSVTLKVFILVVPHLSYEFLSQNSENTKAVRGLLQVDKRIVLWRGEGAYVPEVWHGPLFFDYDWQPGDSQCVLGVTDSGFVGIWERAEKWNADKRVVVRSRDREG
ncbi:hypothetical protein DL96DRAFT_202848 [Flagelloscypha sp. PMI_526]|nr:hypothetical protein DL96DRAFT_202848 [Flagelloscypha sp. PMI_526]